MRITVIGRGKVGRGLGGEGAFARLVDAHRPELHAHCYFMVASLDEALSRASDAGGGALAGPLDLRAGQIAVVRDPQWAVFGMFESETEAFDG